MTRDYQKLANEYAEKVVSGEIIACLYVKQACQRHLNDLLRIGWRYRFNPELIDNDGRKYRPGTRVCAFLERLKHVKGKWRGEPFILSDWQIFVTCVGFGWVNSDGLRRFRLIYEEVPRKNGKSIWSAGIGLYMMVADGEYGAEVYVGANGEEQANKVFAPAWQMVSQEPDLQDLYSIQIYGNTPDTGRLGTTTDYSKMQRLIGNPKDGDMPSCYCCDEFHEHPDSLQYDTMTTGMGSRSQPMTVVTTTAGINKDGPCYETRNVCLSILNGTIENDTIFCIIYTIDQGDDWTSLDVWKKANPNFGISFYAEYVEGKLMEAQQTLSKQAIIKCKNLNIWLDSYNSWLDMDLWRKCEDTTLDENNFRSKYPCFEGADLGAVSDLCARARLYKRNGEYYCFSKFYLPEEVANDETKTNYKIWTHHGYINTNPGRSVDFIEIGDEIYDDIVGNRTFKEFALDVGFAAWSFFQRLQKRLENLKGKKATDEMLIEYGKNVKNFSEPMKQLEKAMVDGIFHHDGNPVMSWCVGNIVVRIDKAENIFATKDRADDKIDGGDALITAFARAMMYDDDEYVANDGSLI